MIKKKQSISNIILLADCAVLYSLYACGYRIGQRLKPTIIDQTIGHMTEHSLNTFLKNTPWSQLQRLKYIERCLLWNREITSNAIAETFAVTRQRAHQDISTYKELAPRNVQPYYAASRAHRASINFAPVLLDDDLEGVFSTQGLVSPHITYMPKLERRVLTGVIPVLLSAIEEGHSIKAVYASKTHPDGIERIMHPVCVVFTLNRAHLRAYCRERQEYRDFLLSRFLAVPSFVSPNLIPDDSNFAENVTLRLIVNPQLKDAEFEMISKEFGIINSKEVQIKRCCLNYFLRENNLPATHEQMEEAQTNPWSYPIIPVYDTEMFYEKS